MKRFKKLLPIGLIVALLSVLVLMTMPAFATPVSSIAPCPLTGQLGYWKLDDGPGATTAADSADDLHGTIIGATSTTGKVNGAFAFVDTNLDEIDMGNVLNFANPKAALPFSGEAWIKTSPSVHQQYILSKMVYGGAMTGWAVYVRSNNKLAFMLSSNYAASPKKYTAVYGSTTITDGSWHHVAFTYDGLVYGDIGPAHLGIELYVDGVKQSLTKIRNWMWWYHSGYPIQNSANFQIGGVDASSPWEHFTGTIDEVAVYNRVLSATEIQQHYNNGLVGKGYCEVPPVPMASFVIDHAKLDFKKKPNDDKVHVQGTLALDLVNGDDVDISEDVTVTVGPLSQTINMEQKGKQGEKWEYKRPKDDGGIIKHMTINWKNGKFDFHMDKADLSGLTDPDEVTISIQIGDDVGEAIITMTETKHWDYKAP